jgi:hypothetical protein
MSVRYPYIKLIFRFLVDNEVSTTVVLNIYWLSTFFLSAGGENPQKYWSRRFTPLHWSFGSCFLSLVEINKEAFFIGRRYLGARAGASAIGAGD